MQPAGLSDRGSGNSFFTRIQTSKVTLPDSTCTKPAHNTLLIPTPFPTTGNTHLIEIKKEHAEENAEIAGLQAQATAAVKTGETGEDDDDNNQDSDEEKMMKIKNDPEDTDSNEEAVESDSDDEDNDEDFDYKLHQTSINGGRRGGKGSSSSAVASGAGKKRRASACPTAEDTGRGKRKGKGRGMAKRRHTVGAEPDSDDEYLETDGSPEPSGSTTTATGSRYKRSCARRWTESDDDKVAFLREYGHLKWHEVTEFINGRHTPQAVQMRYLRSLKRRNDKLTDEEESKLQRLVVEDYETRFKRLSTAMGPAFTPIRIQKIFLSQCGMGSYLDAQKTWTKADINRLVDEAGGDFDNFAVPLRSDELPKAAQDHMADKYYKGYEELVSMYVGGEARNMKRK